MNFDLTDAQRLIREMVREFAEKEIRPRAPEIDRTDEFPWDLWKRMAELTSPFSLKMGPALSSAV